MKRRGNAAPPRGKPTPTILQRRIIRSFSRDAALLIPPFQRDLIAAFALLGRRARRAFLDLRPEPVKQTDPTDADFVYAIRRSMQIDDWIPTRLEPAYQGVYLRTLEATTETIRLNLGLAINIPDAVGRRVVAEGGRRLGLVDIKGQARTSLFHALAEGRAQGMAREELARHIRDRITRGPWRSVETRGLVIARTETLHAQRISAVEVYKTDRRCERGSGLGRADRFDTDAECEERDGRVFSFNDADGETSLEHPSGTLSWAPYVSR